MLLQSGYEIFYEKGYHGAGLNDILKKAGVPKGSFYHYFENKEAFLVEVLQYYKQKAREGMSPFLMDKDKPALERFRAYIGGMIEGCEVCSCTGGCFFGNMAQEMSDSSEVVRESIQGGIQAWYQGLEQFFITAQKEGTLSSEYCTNELANMFVDGWQGALLRMKVEKTTEPLHRFLNGFLKILSM